MDRKVLHEGIKEGYLNKFGKELNYEVYTFTILCYARVLIKLMLKGKFIRLPYLGTLRPRNERMRIDIKENTEIVGLYELRTYLCGRNREGYGLTVKRYVQDHGTHYVENSQQR